MSDGLLKLEKHHIESILEKGYAEVTLPTGEVITIDRDDLLFKADEIDQFSERMKHNQIKNN